MKKTYQKPTMAAQLFAANEYVAACWSINCNVPYGVGYIETNGKPGYQKGGWGHEGDQTLAEGRGCGKYHEVSGVESSGPKANAMWQDMGLFGEYLGKPYEVYHWVDGTGNKGHHFSKVENAEWNPNPNAS